MASWLRARWRDTKWRHALLLLLLLGASILVKSATWGLTPQIFNDSSGYLVPALGLLDGRGYGTQENGFRTPTYPLFLTLALAAFEPTPLADCTDAHRPVCIGKAAQTREGERGIRAVVGAQILLGLLIVILLYILGVELTGNALVGLLFGAGYALNIATAFWEISILTETLTTFLVTLSIWLTLRAVDSGWRIRFALGLTLGALALCHSLFLVYWVVPALFLLWRTWNRSEGHSRRHSSALVGVAPVILIPVLALLSWSAFNYVVNGFFTPSTLSGYVSVQLVAPQVERAPAQYQEIAGIYIGYRDALIGETGSWSGAIFRAWPVMLRETGLTWSQLSRQLTELSLYLMVTGPLDYLRVAAQGWGRFWDFAFYHYDPVPPGAGQWVLWFTDLSLQRALVVLLALALLALSVLRIVARKAEWARGLPGIVLMCATIAFAAAMSSLTNFQDNARFRSYVLPLQYAVIVFAVWSGWRILRGRLAVQATHSKITITPVGADMSPTVKKE